jgi:N-acetylglucosamine-6-sulfatase
LQGVAPSRRSPILLALALLLVVTVLAACGTSKTSSPSTSATTPASVTTPSSTLAPSPAHPNIIYVLTDDLADNLVTPQFMPNLWKLEHDGADFTHYYVTDSLCCPSRASIFTGRYPHDTGVFTNSGTDGGYSVFESRGDENSTLATDLSSEGYRTAMMGKYLNLYTPQDPPAPGWDQWDVAGKQGYNEFDYGLNENGKVVHYGGPKASKDNYLTDVLSGLANQFVTTSTTGAHASPFFLEIATFAPHQPYVPAPKYANLYPGLEYPVTPAYNYANQNPPKWLKNEPPLGAKEEAVIDRAFRLRAQDVKSVDDMIGQLVATLKRTGAWNNTYLVFNSDNGYHMGEHRLRPGKLTAFDTDINVPLIVVGPHVPAGKVIPSFAENIDLRPTFDQWAGTVPSEGIDGRSLVPLLNDPTAPAGWPQGILVEHHGPDGASDDPDYPAHLSGNPDSYEALRLNGELYVEYANGQREFYDLTRDPYELDNTYADLSAATVDALHRELVRVENCHDAPVCSDITVPST